MEPPTGNVQQENLTFEQLREAACASQTRESPLFQTAISQLYLGPFFTTRETFDINNNEDDPEDFSDDELPRMWQGDADTRGAVDKGGALFFNSLSSSFGLIGMKAHGSNNWPTCLIGYTSTLVK
jgi:hypothetical protein